MEQSRTITNPETSTSSSSSSTQIRIRKKRIQSQSSSSSSTNPNNSLWKSEKTQQLYSTKLINALRHVRITPTSPSAPRGSRLIREAADTALAVAAKGRSRWSRAILVNKIKLKYLSHKHKRQKVNITGPNRLHQLPSKSMIPTGSKVLSLKASGKGIGNGKGLMGVERKVKTLGKLVPGCRKETVNVILEEASDYIPALEMQIRAMRDLLSRLTAASGGSSIAGDGESVVGQGSGSGSGSNNLEH